MKKLVVILMVWCSLLVGCSTDFKKVEGNKTGSIKVYVDPETGVNYLIFEEGYHSGITVRYNADGSIMVTKKEGASDAQR